MSSLWSDFVYAIRRLRKDPQLVIVVTIVLGLGIGASTAIFSVVHGVLLEALPYKDPGRLVVILSQSVRQGGQGSPVAPANFYDWREQSDSFESMSAAELWGPTLTGYDVAEELRGLRASANLFETLGVAPLLGHGFSPEDENSGSERVRPFLMSGLYSVMTCFQVSPTLREWGTGSGITREIRLGDARCGAILCRVRSTPGIPRSHFPQPARYAPIVAASH